MTCRLHLTPYQEIIMKKFNNEENARLLKVRKITCGGHMIDALTGREREMALAIEEGLLYTWGNARKQPYGLPNHHAVSATEIKTLSDLGEVYE